MHLPWATCACVAMSLVPWNDANGCPEAIRYADGMCTRTCTAPVGDLEPRKLPVFHQQIYKQQTRQSVRYRAGCSSRRDWRSLIWSYNPSAARLTFVLALESGPTRFGGCCSQPSQGRRWQQVPELTHAVRHKYFRTVWWVKVRPSDMQYLTWTLHDDVTLLSGNHDWHSVSISRTPVRAPKRVKLFQNTLFLIGCRNNIS